MIIRGDPGLGLQKHQQNAYSAIQKAYINGNKACVVIPTGCGKSFIALQLMTDNKDKRILFIVPTKAIRNQIYNYIAKYIVGEEPTKKRSAKMVAEGYFPSLKIMLYSSLLRVKDEQMAKLNADIIIMDELHRTGADKWGEKVNTLLARNSQAQILGLTATPNRMDDKNVVDELFEGNVNYELTLIEALRNGIVKAPTYVKCDYALGEYLEGIRVAIAKCSNEEQRRELQDKYDRMRKIVDQADGIPELFEKNIKKKDGKYIIFCKDKEHMDELKVKSKEWFGSIDDKPEIYSVFSGEGYTDKANKRTIENFEKSKSGHIKLLFCIEMLNEGLHVEDISGVIMARPTESRIIYLQQLGRALSSDTSRDRTIVFDLVNNYLKNNLDAEINERTKDENGKNGGTSNNGGNKGENTEIQDIDIFRITGETKEFLELLEEAQGIITKSKYLSNAKEIKRWMEERGTTKPPSTSSKDENEKRLGTALASIRQQLIKPYLLLQTEEEKEEFRERHPEIDEVMAIVNEIDENNISPYLINAREIKKWMEEKGTTRPPSTKSKDENEKRLGIALASIRQCLIKPYLLLQTEEEKEEFREKHPEIDEVIAIVNEIDENNISIHLGNAREIKKWMKERGTTKPPSRSSKDENEKRFGTALASIRQHLIKPYLLLQTEEEKEEFREKYPEIDEVMAIVNEIDENNISPYLINAREIKRWMEEKGMTRPPSTKSKDENEKRLGIALRSIRQGLIKPYLLLQTEEEKEEFRERHPEIDEVMAIVNEIDENNISPYLINARKIKKWMEERGTTKLPTASSKDENERRLSTALANIRRQLIKPYLLLQTEEEKEEFREKHPEIDEVMAIISELDMQCGNKNQKKLAEIIREDLEKREILGKARKLEKAYEAQLLAKQNNQTKPEILEKQSQGVNFDE